MNCVIETAPQLALTAVDVAALREDLASCHALYAPLFQQREQKALSYFYLQGLLSSERRKSVERMVLHQRGADPNAVRTAQMFVGQGRWQDRALLARQWREVAQTQGHAQGVMIVDGSDFRKQGSESLGVARQYFGETGQEGQLPGGRVCGVCQCPGGHPDLSAGVSAPTLGGGCGLGPAAPTL